jgi:hypothetical protein
LAASAFTANALLLQLHPLAYFMRTLAMPTMAESWDAAVVPDRHAWLFPTLSLIGEAGKGHWPTRSASAARFSARLSRFVSNRPMWAARCGRPMATRAPTAQRLAGVAAQPLGIGHVFVAGQPTEC